MTRDRYPQRRYFLICLFTAVIVLTCGLASAQDPPSTATADIPFDFYISGVKMAAGPYTLDRIAATYVLLRSQDGKSQQDLYFLQSAPPTKNLPSKLLFALRDGKYYLSGIWSAYGKSQLSSFAPKAGDQTKDVPLKPVEKTVAKPSSGL
jgi:hypothetical protein